MCTFATENAKVTNRNKITYMEQKKYKRTTVTSALPYANGGVHIGHLAGVYVPADIYVRYLRLKKEDVMFVGGSDEHGVPITIRARKEGVTPQDIVDRYHKMIKDSFDEFGISFDVYSRTTSEMHRKTASEFFRKLYDEGKLTEETTKQYYDEEAKQFLADRYITGECLVSATERIPGMAEGMDTSATQGVATERLRTVQVVARHGPAAESNDTRPQLGHTSAGGRS